MKNKIILLITILNSFIALSQTIDVTSYGATPNNATDDDTNAIRSAINACKTLSTPTLYFPTGTYHLKSENGGGNFFVIQNLNNLIIDGSGSTIEVVGKNYDRNIFYFNNSNNLNVKNLNIDYQSPPFSQGEIVGATSNTLDIKVFDGFDPNGKLIKTYAEYDKTTLEIVGSENYADVTWQWIDQSNKIIRMNSNSQNYKSGSYILIRHSTYGGNAFLTSQSTNVTYNGITVNLSAGYPFLTNEGSENVSFLNCKLKKKNGFWATSTADASHNLDVRGALTFDNCHFEGMLDDGINIHGYFSNIEQKIDNYTLQLRSPESWHHSTGTKAGDIIVFFDRDTQLPIGEGIIENISNWNGNVMTVKFTTPLPEFTNGISKYKTANKSLVGSLTVKNSFFGSNRARGILVSTGDVLIENCTFQRTLENAILFEVSINWKESLPANNVIIRNNIFDDCSYSNAGLLWQGVIYFYADVGSTQNACGVFKNITIEGNTFKNIKLPAINALYVDGLNINGNTIQSSTPNMNIIRYGNSKNVMVDNNTGANIVDLNTNCDSASSNGTNVALNKLVTCSNDVWKAAQTLVDENETTRWAAQYYPQWIEIDLGNIYDITRFEIFPYLNRDFQYYIEIKTKPTDNYTTVVDKRNNTLGDVKFVDNVLTTGRYMKVTITGAYSQSTSWAALSEIKAFGTLSELSVNDIIKSDAIKVFPIPADQELQIMLDKTLKTPSASIMDLSGRIVLTKSLQVGQNAININSIASGIYVLSIKEDNREIKLQKIIIN